MACRGFYCIILTPLTNHLRLENKKVCFLTVLENGQPEAKEIFVELL